MVMYSKTYLMAILVIIGDAVGGRCDFMVYRLLLVGFIIISTLDSC